VQTHPNCNRVRQKQWSAGASAEPLSLLLNNHKTDEADEQAAEEHHPRSEVSGAGQFDRLVHHVEEEVEENSDREADEEYLPASIQRLERHESHGDAEVHRDDASHASKPDQFDRDSMLIHLRFLCQERDLSKRIIAGE